MSVVDRTPPHDFDAEQAILGSIMMIDGSYRTLSETLRVEHFADPLHGRIFEAAGAMVDRGDKVTPLTLRPYLGQDQGLRRRRRCGLPRQALREPGTDRACRDLGGSGPGPVRAEEGH